MRFALGAAMGGGLLLHCLAAFGAGQPSAPSTQPSVEQWGIFGQSFAGPSTGNPFIDNELTAIFTSGTQTISVRGFYDGNGIYRIRFMPQSQGHWVFTTKSNVPSLSGLTGSFECTPPSPSNLGPVQVANVHHFAHADGTPFIVIGTTCYSWTDQPDAIEEKTLASLRSSPFNKVRMCLLPQTKVPLFYPYEKDSAGKFDLMRFNPAYFQHLEKRIQQLSDAGIEADIILFHPYSKGAMAWFDDLDNAGDDRYLRYAVARLSAFRNVWWSLANEYGQVKHKTDPDWDHFFQLVAAEDPYGHLRSIHNAAKFYDSNKPWVTHVSIQNGSAVANFGRAVQYREVWPKPVVYDEVCYEGHITSRWGQLTGQEMTRRFWMATIAGTYCGHGETLPSPLGVSWTGGGGQLMGQSPPRLAFLRKILESGPREGIEPIDEFYETNIGGKAGVYYLFYFGPQTPTAWKFAIPRDPPAKTALDAGMKFHVDILDTWNMTITPVDQIFTTTKLAGSFYNDVKNTTIPLPGLPDIALRIQRIP